MASTRRRDQRAFHDRQNALDAARAAFAWLVAGPDPVSVDGCLFDGLPDRPVPLDELRERLLRRGSPQRLRDAVWAHLVLRSRTDCATWTVGCVGMALPALTRTAAKLAARFSADPADIHATVLAGFVAELARIDLCRPKIALRLRWAAYRAGYASVRADLDAPIPSGHGFSSAAPPPPWGHPDLVLVRAIADGVITRAEAELIGATRLEKVSLVAIAAATGANYNTVKSDRFRAEQRLVAYLREQAAADPPACPGPHDGRPDYTATTRTRVITELSSLSRSVTRAADGSAKKVSRRVHRSGPKSGVQGCGRRPATPATSIRPPRHRGRGPARSEEAPR